jgi:hypothetical protein
MEPKWQTIHGDEWWCDSAVASRGAGRFLIDTFGHNVAEVWIKSLLADAIQFDFGHVDVTLTDANRRLIQGLLDRGELVAFELQLGDRWPVARITSVGSVQDEER